MPVWKVLLVGVLACVCMALATSVFVVPFNYSGGERWAWMVGLVAATVAAGGLFAAFLRHAAAGLLVRVR